MSKRPLKLIFSPGKSFQMAVWGCLFFFCLSLPSHAQEEVTVCLTQDGQPTVSTQGVGALERKWKKTTLTVGYLDGTDALRQKVTQIAQIWSQYGGITFIQIADWRQADIKITFYQGTGYQSAIGTDAQYYRSSASMSLEGFTEGMPINQMQRATLHEFGHALGLQHEHQSPAGGIQWNVPAVYEYFRKLGWSDEEIRHNVLERVNSSLYTQLDRLSVMIYPIPPELTLNGFSSPWNYELSETDKTFIAQMYPRFGSPAIVNLGFDAHFYFDLYPGLRDVYKGDTELAFVHWKTRGIHEGRRGSPAFDARFYLDHNSDVRNAFGSANYQAALDHWLNYGIDEGRRGSIEFDPKFYLFLYPALKNIFGPANYRAAVEHWLRFGTREGRRGSVEFDATYYLNYYSGLKSVFGASNYRAGLEHWILFGLPEGRRGSREFDVGYYLERYSGLKSVFGVNNYRAALEHWILFGIREGRQGSPHFDVSFYISYYPDINNTFAPVGYPGALGHWIKYGFAEGRKGIP